MVKDEVCSIEGCENSGFTWTPQLLCTMHKRRWRETGKFGPPKSIFAEPSKYTDAAGYVVVSYRNTKNYEHRLIMQEMLGRPLLRSETVHHKNGDRKDNRPENLELWSTWQPGGQRVEDKIAWAEQFLKEYAPEKLRL